MVRKTEFASGDAAESNAFKTVFFSTSHDASVARGQLFLLELCRDAVGDDGSNRVDDILARQIVSLRDFSLPRRLLVTLLEHQLITLLAQLHTSCGMDGIVDALMQRMEAA